MTDLLVIGGGAAGLMAAGAACAKGLTVTVLEHNPKGPGQKLLITGKGRCNVTSDSDVREFLPYVRHNGRFLYSSLYAFPPAAAMQLFEELGVPLKTERGRRVFPRSEKASDVNRALARLLQHSGVEVRLHSRVKALVQQGSCAAGVLLENGETIPADAVILACGGKTYPMTGSDGDGYTLAQSAGHSIQPLSGVLNAIETAADWPCRLQGLSLKNVTLTLRRGKQVLYSALGEMLFTHFGISGPLTLTMSSHLPEDLSQAEVALNLKPGLTPQQLDARLQRDLEEQSRKQLRNVLPGLLPGRMAELFPELCGVDGGKPCCQITREERERLRDALQALPIPLRRLAPMEEAIVTRGGVTVKEINPATMESRLLPGLHFAGEMIDVDAHTGGYNLQIAWSTGALAGYSAARGGY